MTINRDSEEYVREAERSVNRVWTAWRQEFDSKSSKEVLAMVAYQFAKLYYQQQHLIEGHMALIEEFEAQLDSLLELTLPEPPAGDDSASGPVHEALR